MGHPAAAKTRWWAEGVLGMWDWVYRGRRPETAAFRSCCPGAGAGKERDALRMCSARSQIFTVKEKGSSQLLGCVTGPGRRDGESNGVPLFGTDRNRIRETDP